MSFIKNVSPKLPTAAITLIDPGLEFLWPVSNLSMSLRYYGFTALMCGRAKQVGAVRGFVSKDFSEKIFRPIAEVSKKQPNVTVIKERATGINVAEKSVQTSGGQTIPYDFCKLVCYNPVVYQIGRPSLKPKVSGHRIWIVS